MKRRRLIRSAMLGLFIVVGGTTAGASADTLTADQLCLRADQFIETAELDAARADYDAAAGAGADCGRQGQRTVAGLDGEIARLMAETKTLATIDDSDGQELVDNYLAVLAIDNRHPGARAALTSSGVLPDACENTYNEPLELLAAGYDDDARTRAREILTESPDCPIPDELTAANPLGLTNDLSDIGTQLERLTTALVQLILAAAAVAAVGGLFVATGLKFRRHYPGSRKVQLIIGTITGPKANEDLGPDVVQILSTELAETSSYAESMRSIGGGSTDLGAITAALPDQVKFIGPILDWIRRPVRFTLNGRLVHVDENRVIINLVLTDRRGKTIAARRFTREPLGDLTAARAASIEAAAWLAFQVLELQYPRKPADTYRSILGSTSWASYANIRLARLAGDTERSKLLDRALYHDRRNVAALREVGYAMTDKAMPSIGRFDTDAFEKGLGYLESAVNRLEATGDQKWRRWPFSRLAKQARFDPLWYQTMYAIVLAQAHGYSADEDGKKAESFLDHGIAHAVELTRAVGHTQRALRGRFSRYAVGERRALGLQAMFDRDGAYLAGVLAGVLTSHHYREIDKPGADAATKGVDLCTKPESLPTDQDALWKYVTNMAPWPGWTSEDVLTTAQTLHHAVVTADLRGSDVLAYNRACTYARGRVYGKAKDELLASLDHLDELNLRRTIDGALVDPALTPLLTHATHGPAIIAELKKRRPPSEEVRAPSQPVQQSRWTVEIFG